MGSRKQSTESLNWNKRFNHELKVWLFLALDRQFNILLDYGLNSTTQRVEHNPLE